MSSDKFVLIGKITSVHGIKGQFKLDFYSETAENFRNYKVFYNKDGEIIQLKPDFYKNKQVVAHINDVKSRNDAEKLIGTEIFIKREELKPLKQNEFYINDLVGLKVLKQANNKEIGIVNAIHNFGAGDIIEIKFTNEGKNINQMFALTDYTFPEINIESGYLVFVHPEIIVD